MQLFVMFIITTFSRDLFTLPFPDRHQCIVLYKKISSRFRNLSRNYISYLDTQSFESLPYLEELKLSRNHLNASTFSRTAHIFRNLTNLRTL